MYPVSLEYINKLKSKDVKIRRIRGYVDSYEFTENDLLTNSFGYTDICVNSADIKLGGVYVGKLSLTFLQSFLSRVPRGTWKDRIITCSVGLFLGYDANNQERWEDVTLKPFTVYEANYSALGVDVTCYDAMSKFDATIQMSMTSGNLYGMTSLACLNCGVQLGMTAEEMAALPNGDQILGLYPDNDIETWRDLISWIAVTIGGFATINREGKLVFRTWKDTADIEIGINDRFKGGTWSDFSTNYSAITVNDKINGTQDYYAVIPDTGMTMDIGDNPLIQYGLPETKEQQARNILNAIQNLKYVPFSSTSLIDPALDLGDVILYSDGIADDALCCVMRIDFSFRKGATVKGYGKNPAISGARSKQDKAIAQQAKNQKNQSIIYYPYINSEEIEIGTTERRLYRIAFATAEPTTVEMAHEMKMLSEFTASTQGIHLYYYYDGDLLTYEPEETYDEEGYHILKGDYWIQGVEAGETHYWEVKAKVDSGTATIAINDLRALLKGQGMVASVGFDGNLELADEYEPWDIGMDVVSLTDSVVITRQTAGVAFALSDVFTAWSIGQNVVQLTDSFNLKGDAPVYNRITQDGDNRFTQDGDQRVTSN